MLGERTKTAEYFTASSAANTLYAYDTYGRVTVVTDPLGRTSETRYSATHAEPVWVEDAKNYRTSFAYDTLRRLIKVTGPNGDETHAEYNWSGRLAKVWEPTEPPSGAPTTLYDYDIYARPVKVQERRLIADYGSSTARTTHATYLDGFGRTIQTQTQDTPGLFGGQNRRVASTWFNSVGLPYMQTEPVIVADPAGSGYHSQSLTFAPSYQLTEYDSSRRPVKVRQMSNGVEQWHSLSAYQGWTRTDTDAENNVTRSNFDGRGNLTRRVVFRDPAIDLVTTYDYDNVDRLVEVTDTTAYPAPIVTSVEYDLAGRKTELVDPDSGTWTYGYDLAGNLAQQTDGESDTTTYTYDSLNRPLTRKVGGVLKADWAYNANLRKGVLTRSRNLDGPDDVIIDYEAFDAADRPTQVTYTVGAAATGGGVFRQKYTFHHGGRLETVQYPSDNAGGLGQQDLYGYWAESGELAAITRNSDITSYGLFAQYSRSGQLEAVPYGVKFFSGGAAQGWDVRSYDSLGRVRNIDGYTTTSPSGTPLGTDLGYQSYDDNGNIVQMTDWRNQSQRQCFTYDQSDQLTRAFTTNNNCVSPNTAGADDFDHTYTYTRTGGLATHTGTGTYSYGAGNAGPHAVTAITGGYSFAYDDNGDMTSRTVPGEPTQTIDYNYDRTVAAITSTANVTTMAYDVDGNRALRDDGTNTTVYLPHGYEHITNNTTGTKTSRKTTVFAGHTIATETPIGSDITWLYTNHQGSITGTYNPTTATINNERY